MLIVLIVISAVSISGIITLAPHVTVTKADDVTVTKTDDVAVTQKAEPRVFSVSETDFIEIQTNQSAVDQFLDNIDTCILGQCIRATEKFAIAMQPVIIDSNNNIKPQDTVFYPIPVSQTLLDEEGNILDLGSINFGFFAITDIDDTLTVTASYKVVLNGNIIEEKDLFGKGKTSNKTLLLKSGDRKTFAFTFADEPVSAFREGTGANLMEVFITKVDAVVGTTPETTRRFLSDEEFPIYRTTFTFDGNKHVVRDHTGTAVSVFKSDNVFRACGQAFVYDEKIPFRDYDTRRVQGYANPPVVEVFQNEKKLGQTSTPDYSKTKRDGGFMGTACSEVTGLPRESTLVFKVEGNSYTVRTGKTQEIHSVVCSNAGIKDGVPLTKCSSSFGWSR